MSVQKAIEELAAEVVREEEAHAKSASCSEKFVPSPALAEKLGRHAAEWPNARQLLNLEMEERDPLSRDN